MVAQSIPVFPRVVRQSFLSSTTSLSINHLLPSTHLQHAHTIAIKQRNSPYSFILSQLAYNASHTSTHQLNMSNGWDHYSPGWGSKSYPTPAPSPQFDNKGVPLPPSAQRHHLPLPFSTPRPHLHPLLGYAYRPGIAYDVREHPSSASTPHARLDWAQETATNPPSPEMTIICHMLPHPFVVLPSGRHYNYVTVHDVLLAVHFEFSEAIRAAETRSNGLRWTDRRPGETAASSSLLLGRHPGGLDALSAGRYMWKGMSEEISPGKWLLHIE